MKTKIILLAMILSLLYIDNIYAQTASNKINIEQNIDSKTTIPNGIGMKKEVLENRVRSKVLLDVDDKSVELISDGIEAVEITKRAVAALHLKNDQAAIDYIGAALGKLETIAVRNPEMTAVPVSRVIRTEDLDTDTGAIKIVKQVISKAIDDNKFHTARKALESLMSEVRIETTHIPIGSYPETLKKALIAIEKSDLENAKSSLNEILNTLTVSKQYISLPCMRAEVLLEESIGLSSKNTNLIENRKLLLLNAKNQINIAHELGQIDKENFQKIGQQIDQAMKALGTTRFNDLVHTSLATIVEAKKSYSSEPIMNI